MTETTCIYLDTQDPQNPGWAWRHDGSSGPVDGDLGEDAPLQDVLDRACGSDVPLSLADPSLWRPIQGGKGWEIPTYRPRAGMYPREVAQEVALRRPDLCGGDAVAAVLMADPSLTAADVISILDESRVES